MPPSQASDTQSIILRRTLLSDLTGIECLERETLSPWSISLLVSECQVANGLSFVAEDVAFGIIGWCGCRTIWPEAELLKIAVMPKKRGVGVGYALLEKMIDKLQQGGFETLFLEVRSLNHAALSFYLRNNFSQVGLRRNYYLTPQDNARVLRRDLKLV